jgi:hypothetical protein
MDPRLQSYIATRDRRIAKTRPWDSTPLAGYFAQLLEGRAVIVGGRASCGGAVDPTWTEYCLWREVVKKARALGHQISETSIKHGNGWATKCGGFWDESEYRLTNAPKDDAKD